jgi:hypothetical protein
MARKKVTKDELGARAKASGYKRGVYQEEDSHRDSDKYIDKIKQDEDASLDGNVEKALSTF